MREPPQLPRSATCADLRPLQRSFARCDIRISIACHLQRAKAKYQIRSLRSQKVVSVTCWACKPAPEHNDAAETLAAERFSVRPATRTDSDAMGLLEHLSGGFWTAKELAEQCSEPRTVLLVATDHDSDGRVVGLILAWCIADEVQIIEVAVHPRLHRQGIGLCLMEAALAVGHRRLKETAGRGAAVLEVNVDNTPAVALYTKLGFKRVGYRRDYYPDGSDAILMRMPIS